VNECASKEEAISLFGTAPKRPITQEHFDNNLINSPFLRMFQYGQAQYGYWTHWHMRIQTEDLIDTLKAVFPSNDFFLLFNQSSGHKKKWEDGLNVHNMNQEHGRKVPDMHQAVFDANYLGVHNPLIEAGGMQELVFPTAEKCESEDGPFSMSVEERMRRQHDILLPATKTDNKSAIELKAELTASNIDIPLRPNLANLQALAGANNK
jgi:hypothetical protein